MKGGKTQIRKERWGKTLHPPVCSFVKISINQKGQKKKNTHIEGKIRGKSGGRSET